MRQHPYQAKADTPGEETLETEARACTPAPDGKEGAEVAAVSEGEWDLYRAFGERALLRDLSGNQNLSLQQQLTQN